MIRLANKIDLPVLVEMMRGYASESPMPLLADPANHDEQHICDLLISLIAGRGFVLLDDKNRGMLAAIVVQNVWCPAVLELKELAWWVEPEHRNGSVGGRLFIKFNEIADAYLQSNRVQSVAMSLLESSKVKNLPGYKKIEATFLRM